MKKQSLLLVMLLTLVGCADSAYIAEQNQAALSSGGEYVGNLSDGTAIVRYRIKASYDRDHWVYVAGATVTANQIYVVDHGDHQTTHNQVVVTYVPE